jgi:Xaa-Pro aminopeptidase
MSLAYADKRTADAVLAAPRFSTAERDRRYAAVRAAMKERGFACLIVPHNTGDWDNCQPDLRYLSCVGGGGMAAGLVFPLEGEPIAAVREARRVDWWRAAQDWIEDIRSPRQFRWSTFFVEAIREIGADRAKIGVVGLADVLREPEGIVSFGEFSAIRAALPHASFESATDLLARVRKRKSGEEIAMIQRAQACADAIGVALRNSARPGVSEHEVYAAMLAANVRWGGEMPAMVLIGSGSRMWQTQLQPSFRCLAADDIVLVEAEPKFYGYMAQTVDTVSMRPLTRDEAHLLAVSHDCFWALSETMRPGVSYREAIAAWTALARKAGRRPGRTMGHGLGLGQDGPLTTPDGGADGWVIEENDCFVLKPWISDESDRVSGRVGGTVVIERNGARKLGQAQLQPFVLAR